MEGGLSRLLLETRKTSDTLSTKTPILSPLNPAIIILVSFVTPWLEIPSFSAKLMTGITTPRRSITPKTWSGRSGILFICSNLFISWTSEISIANRSSPTVKPISCKTLLTSFCNGISGNLHSLFAVKYLFDLLPQRLCSKWLHDVIIDARLDRLHDVFFLFLCRYYEHRDAAQSTVCAYGLQQIKAGHIGHIPI